jgi:type I restriction enzyme, S subunit
LFHLEVFHKEIPKGVVKLGDEDNNGVPTLLSSNVRHLNIVTDVIMKISLEIANQYKRTRLQGGEVLITVRGTLGGVAIVPNELAGCNISREVAMIALVDKRVAQIVQYFIASKPLQIWLTKRTRGIAYTGINIETLKELPIPLPPLEEQRRIVAEVERRLSVARQVESAVDGALVRASRLRQAVLKSAFEGKLSPSSARGDSQ